MEREGFQQIFNWRWHPEYFEECGGSLRRDASFSTRGLDDPGCRKPSPPVLSVSVALTVDDQKTRAMCLPILSHCTVAAEQMRKILRAYSAIAARRHCRSSL